jgi:hypothetical protein
MATNRALSRRQTGPSCKRARQFITGTTSTEVETVPVHGDSLCQKTQTAPRPRGSTTITSDSAPERRAILHTADRDRIPPAVSRLRWAAPAKRRIRTGRFCGEPVQRRKPDEMQITHRPPPPWAKTARGPDWTFRVILKSEHPSLPGWTRTATAAWECPTSASASFDDRPEKPGSGPTACVALAVKMSAQNVGIRRPEVAALATRRCAGHREGATLVEW